MDRDTLIAFNFELGMSYKDIIKSLAALHGIIFHKEGGYDTYSLLKMNKAPVRR